MTHFGHKKIFPKKCAQNITKYHVGQNITFFAGFDRHLLADQK